MNVILICQSFISDTFTFLLFQYLFLSISIINTISCIFAEGGQYWTQDGHLSKRTSAGRTTFIFVRYVCVGYRMYSVKNKSTLKLQTGRKVSQTLIWEKAEDLPSKEQLLKARKHLLNPEENETSKSAQNLRFDDFAVFEVQDSTSTIAHTHQTILTQGLQKSWPFTSNISALVKMQI